MWPDASIDLRLHDCNAESLVERCASEFPLPLLSGKQQGSFHLVRLTMCPQQRQTQFRKHGSSLFLTLAAFDVDLHPCAIDILDSQLTDLANAQPRAEGEDGNCTHAQRQMRQDLLEFPPCQYRG
jgi:hypothetical protein